MTSFAEYPNPPRPPTLILNLRRLSAIALSTCQIAAAGPGAGGPIHAGLGQWPSRRCRRYGPGPDGPRRGGGGRGKLRGGVGGGGRAGPDAPGHPLALVLCRPRSGGPTPPPPPRRWRRWEQPPPSPEAHPRPCPALPIFARRCPLCHGRSDATLKPLSPNKAHPSQQKKKLSMSTPPCDH